MNRRLWGQSPDGGNIYTYELSGGGILARVMNYGANLLSLYVPDKNGKLDDVVLGYEKLEDYFVNVPGFGCAVTPFANRIGGATFTLNGETYTLDKNDGNNNLHSGFQPLHRRVWDVVEEDDSSITFAIDMKDGEIGFPGNVHIEVSYTLLPDGILGLDYYAKSDRDTVFNPTNHTYFNLNGHASGDILDHIVWINADEFTYADKESIPDGTMLSVDGTPMDFRTPTKIGARIEDDYEQLNWAGGYDHNYVLKQDKPAHEYDADAEDADDFTTYLVGSLYSENTGRKMEIYTELPGMQLYTGNYLTDSEIGKGGKPYARRGGVAFETQYYPNAVNVPSFPQPSLPAGGEFMSRTVYKFSAE